MKLLFLPGALCAWSFCSHLVLYMKHLVHCVHELEALDLIAISVVDAMPDLTWWCVWSTWSCPMLYLKCMISSGTVCTWNIWCMCMKHVFLPGALCTWNAWPHLMYVHGAPDTACKWSTCSLTPSALCTWNTWCCMYLYMKHLHLISPGVVCTCIWSTCTWSHLVLYECTIPCYDMVLYVQEAPNLECTWSTRSCFINSNSRKQGHLYPMGTYFLLLVPGIM